MAAAAGVPPSSLLRLRLPSPQPAASLPSSSPALLRRRPLLSLAAAPSRASFAAAATAADSSNGNGNGSYSGNGSQASLMPPFSGLMLDESSRSKRPYKWQRVLLKVSGEALAGDHTENIDPKVTMAIAREVASVTKLGVEVAIVVGGGNIFRGASWAGCSGLDRSSADYIGMMATVMNAIFLQATMESIGIPTRVQTAFRISEVAEPYIRRRAIRHLEKGRVVIFAAGTGNPFFTTDTAAALRCAEINAEVVLKATNVDGVYDANPKHNPNARILETVSYNEVISRDLSVMDMTAVTLCQENNIPVVVFNLQNTGNIAKAIVGEKVGTFIGCTRNLEYRESTEGSLDQEDKILVSEW
ncbi:hypothetical protein CFC21_050533 [Triticum aestivum]|uniref:UMP kinase n=3 Tax=Triticinae TaxID=1648030 RepID=A0A3B6H6Q4_WHEAT|nr:uridylate kinase [Aegilops tauschii subsp. strangulata]XP_044359789.1 uridylate kinase-like [Triticum aestivum]KAF7040641.1 hypothetical protein CFC21_050533 [Triticum aestivum]